MKLTGKRNKLTIVLLAATICLWGVILYNIIVYFTTKDDEDTEVVIGADEAIIKPAKNKNTTEEDIFYKEISRDPFVFRVKEPVVEELPVNYVPPPPPKPKLQYTITGTIINEKSKLVIFEDHTNNKTMFLREGESYNSIKIISVTLDKVKLSEEKEIKEIAIKR